MKWLDREAASMIHCARPSAGPTVRRTMFYYDYYYTSVAVMDKDPDPYTS